VGIQTYQNLEKGICELKMPNYWNKARTFFKQFRDGDFKKRYIPLSVLDETEIGRYRPNTISVWFKTPREKEFSFRAPVNYEH
jgi:hypothetical protein